MRPTPGPGATATPSPGATATPSPGATVTPSPSATASPSATPSPTATPGTGSAAGVETWPAGESGWTVILASEQTRQEAETKAEKFAGGGTPGVGILQSDDFSSLAGGYWVVYSGRHPTQKAAEDALKSITTPDAYVRQVTPR